MSTWNTEVIAKYQIKSINIIVGAEKYKTDSMINEFFVLFKL